MASEAIYVSMKDIPPESLDGKTFQVYVRSNYLVLYPVSLSTRCPVIVGGEQCVLTAGHEEKHMWGRGD